MINRAACEYLARRKHTARAAARAALIIAGLLLAVICNAEQLATVAAIEGKAWIIARDGQQQTLVNGQTFGPGDTVRTGKKGKVALLLADESLVQLYHGSEFTLNAAAPTAGWLTRTTQQLKSSYQLLKGEMWFRNKGRNNNIQIDTEHVSISVRGTEFSVVAETDSIYVNMLEGRITANNAFGGIEAISGEQVIAERGKAPRKRLLLNPDNAVQWTIQLPAIFNHERFAELLFDSQGSVDRTRFKWDSEIEAAFALARTQAAAGDIDMALATLSAKEFEAALPGHPIVQTYRAWLQLEMGDAALAANTSTAALQMQADFIPALNLATITALINNHSTKALLTSQKAVALAPNSAESQLLKSYAEQANFRLPAAYASANAAVARNPALTLGWIQLARLNIGAGNFEAAHVHLDQAAQNAESTDIDIETIRGYAQLAQGQTSAAWRSFSAASALNIASADLELGKALVAMQRGEKIQALEFIAKAVAIEPLAANYMHYYGRILYETRRFDRAIEVLQRSMELDPNDPTPLYLLAIIQRDLNREGEAIALLQQAASLNDQRAIYRPRNVLDQDLAVKNVDLSLAFQAFNFNAWAQRKAVDAIAQDRSNYSAHLLYAGAVNDIPGRDTVFASEVLKARLLQPANANTFTTYANYTSVFDVPVFGGSLTARTGSFDQYQQDLTLYTALPAAGLALQGALTRAGSDGWRDTNSEALTSKALLAKWDASEKASWLFTYNRIDLDQSDQLSARFEFDSLANPRDNRENKFDRYEIGLHYKIDTQTQYLSYVSLLKSSLDEIDYSSDPGTLSSGTPFETNRLLNIDLNDTIWITQNQLATRYDNQQWLFGLFTYDSSVDRQDINSGEFILGGGAPVPLTLFSIFDINNQRDRSQRSVYIYNQTRLNRYVTVDGAVYWDSFTNSDPFAAEDWNLSRVNPRLGLRIDINPRNTLRLAGYRYLFSLVPGRLDPVDVAGLSIYRGSSPGTLTTEYNIAYEYEWSRGFVQLMGFTSESETELRSFDGIAANRIVSETRRRGGEINLNQLFNKRLGATVSYAYLNINDEPELDTSRHEDLGKVNLSMLTASGLSVQLEGIYRHLRYDNRASNDEFALANLSVDYELKMSGLSATLFTRFNNMFDENFNWVTDTFVIDGRIPERNYQVGLTLGF